MKMGVLRESTLGLLDTSCGDVHTDVLDDTGLLQKLQQITACA